MATASWRQVVAMALSSALVLMWAAHLSAQGGPKPIDFWIISGYNYNPAQPFDPSPRYRPNAIPPAIRALDGQKVTISGNAMAVDYSSGLMSEFILNATIDACGFGEAPRINEWIYVRMANGRKTQVYTAMDMTITGTFRIKEEVEDGRLIGLYSIDADSVQ